MVSHYQVEETLRQRITDGSWPAGSRLPPERDLAEELGASRNTIRKAIQNLAARYYLSLTKNSRPIVAYPQNSESNSRHVATDFGGNSATVAGSIHSLDVSPLEVLEARLLIEPEAVALAALRARSDNIEEIKNALDQSLAAKHLVDFEYWDGQLHQAIFKATHNSVLIGYYGTLNLVRNQPAWIALKEKSVTPERRRLYDCHHSAIVTAIVSRSPDKAKSAMRTHLEAVQKAMLL